ncbi:MAG: hypothetical protein GTO18_10515 [Anaerolineales bacterium]|nr:hypothetical protein [Anaerolineales bacterium]
MKVYRAIIPMLFLLLGLTSCDRFTDESALSTASAATLESMVATLSSELAVTTVPSATAEVIVAPTPLPPTDTPEPPAPEVLKIAFINGGNVWYVEEGGTPAQLTTSGDVERVALSTDGQLVVFLTYDLSLDLYALRVVDTDTGTEAVLITQPELDSLYPLDGAIHHVPHQFEFIPDTHTVLLNTRRTYEGPGLVQNNDLWSIDAETSARTLLFDPGLGGDFYISPSGTQMALVQPTNIGFAQTDGSGRSPDHLIFPFVMTYSEYAYYPVPVWAPDESAVAVLIPPEDPFVDDTARVWRVPLSGAVVPLLDITGFTFFHHSGRTPTIPPDLTKVAFMREITPTTVDLVIAPLDGSPESIYDSGNLSWQGWNPDSMQFVYTDAPLNLILGSLGLPSLGVGFGSRLEWVDADTFLYLDQLTSTHRFGKVDLPGPPSEIAVISGPIFDYDFTK